jgi:hypothetical protein
VLQTINGARIEQPPRLGEVLNKILPFGDPLFPFLGFIDPFGNTIFSGIQMQIFLREWDSLIQQVKHEGAVNEQDVQYLSRVREMAVRCKSEPHVFLRFIGD